MTERFANKRTRSLFTTPVSVGSVTAMRSLSSRIRARRLELGLSQQALAHKATLSPKWLERIESSRGGVNIKLASLLAIASALAVTPGWLLEASEIKPRRERPLEKHQRLLTEIAQSLPSREARLLCQIADYMRQGKDPK